MATTTAETTTTAMERTMELNPDVPVFLRKTYAMVDSCDAEICSWDEDSGETFIIKDPSRFESCIIPQYFKHNKFSSFVRQLNFYSFKKIKFSDALKIDPEYERLTQNYWRFRHEYFRQGRPDLLIRIKRMPNHAASKNKKMALAAASLESKNDSSNTTSPLLTVEKSEVQTLKKRIEEMSKNMDKLTELVQKVSLHREGPTLSASTTEAVGNKRKKVSDVAVQKPEEVTSEGMMDMDDFVSSMPLPERVESEIAALGLLPSRTLLERETSNESDNTYVDQLFSAFNQDTDDMDFVDSFFELPSENQPRQEHPQQQQENGRKSGNQPDPELMRRLGDALELLPRSIQELIVDRLIAAITSTDGLQHLMTVTNTSSSKEVVAVAGKNPRLADKTNNDDDVRDDSTEESSSSTALFTRETLAALLHHYTTHIKVSEASKKLPKALPVVEAHA